MKKFIFTIVFILVVLGLFGFFSRSNNDNSNYQVQRSSTDNNVNNISQSLSTTENTNTASQSLSTKSTDNTSSQTTLNKQYIEIANFSTKIHNKDSARQNNISITCNTLSNTEIKSGEVFSFCNIVGKASTDKGYQKADIYVDGEKKQGLGGGNCQVSTTLYNAVCKVDGLEVIERHEHSGHVPYIDEGKDAAVAYGSYDFKFKNNTENTIRIIMMAEENTITAKIEKLI